jgi:putative addiction module component (TIGR02574 family)
VTSDERRSVYNVAMTDPARLLHDALQLPPEARAVFAGRLLESLDTEVDEGAEREWDAEIARRLAEIDSGTVRTLPWSEVRGRILAASDGKSAR